TALGLLVRPNLLFVAGAPLVMILASNRGRERGLRTALFGLPVALVAVLIAVLNTMWYGSPSNSGYGAAHDLYVAANVWPNLKRYASWLRASQGLWPLLALVPLVPGIGRLISRRVAAACVLIIALTVASYA